MTAGKITLAQLNALEQGEFSKFLGWIFEDSPWVMERAWVRRPFTSIQELHSAAVVGVQTAPAEKQLELLRAHPDLGTRAQVSDVSRTEQVNAGLSQLTAEEFAQLHRWNDAYRARFGFPFLYAVKGSSKHDILAALGQRLQNSPEQEFEQALRQVYRIAQFRLEEAIS
jgi:2-oxo-4-hydroxy-4-carboxy-5-ureidoimidazoline decarboxylase